MLRQKRTLVKSNIALPEQTKSMNINDNEMSPPAEVPIAESSDTIYEEYGNHYAEYGAISVDQLNVDVGENENGDDEDYQEYRSSESESNIPKKKTKKIWISVILAIAIAGLVVGLSVYFTEPPSPLSETASTDLGYITSTATKTLSTAPVLDTSGMQFILCIFHS